MITANEAKQISDAVQDSNHKLFLEQHRETNDIVLTYIYEEIRITCESGQYKVIIPWERILGFYNLSLEQRYTPGFQFMFKMVLRELGSNGYKVEEFSDLSISWGNHYV